MGEVPAILLAAGQSRRMGAFKPLLSFGQSTVIQSCIDYLRVGGADPIVVVAGYRADDLRGALRKEAVTFVVNPDLQSEMSASIAHGVRALSSSNEAVLIALTDQPAIPALVVREVINEWRRRQTKIVLPEFKGKGGHPPLIDLSYREELLHLDPDRGLRGLLDAHRDQVRRLPVSSGLIARDMDTWDDYRQLHLDVFGSEPIDMIRKPGRCPTKS